MRLKFGACAFFALALLQSCTERKFNNDAKSASVVLDLKPNGKGTFNVTCSDGRTFSDVRDTDIMQNEVCSWLPEMTTGAKNVVQIDPTLFNAYTTWRDSEFKIGSDKKVTEPLDYSSEWYSNAGSSSADGVFFVAQSDFWIDNHFETVYPTSRIVVLGDVLYYPPRGNKQLRLKFLPPVATTSHVAAASYCKKQGFRLPTVRELFDFCAAGVREPDYGPRFMKRTYPDAARCGGNNSRLWSASRVAGNSATAWAFYSNEGYVDADYRDRRAVDVKYFARCVTSP